jgi:hypothetical protein
MPSTYEPIATQTLSSNAASVTFSSISGSYTDLILVSSLIGTVATDQYIRFNNDSGSNYSNTLFTGNGSTANSARRTSQTYLIDFGIIGTTANTLSANVLQVMNYSNATTFKTSITRNNLASTQVQAAVGLYRSTSAITRIDLIAGSGNYTSGSTFTLYGVKNA